MNRELKYKLMAAALKAVEAKDRNDHEAYEKATRERDEIRKEITSTVGG